MTRLFPVAWSRKTAPNSLEHAHFLKPYHFSIAISGTVVCPKLMLNSKCILPKDTVCCGVNHERCLDQLDLKKASELMLSIMYASCSCMHNCKS